MTLVLEDRVTDRVELIALDLIDPATDNPRRQVGDVAELAQSIASSGLINPLVVTPRGDRYLLVCGARRHAACLVAELDAVSCVVREFSEAERQEAMLIENLQRVDLSVLEEATSYSRLVELGQTQRQLAERVGRSQAHISKRLAILDLPEDVQQEVDSGGITLEDAQGLTKLAGHPKRLKEVAAEIKRYGASYARHSVSRHLAEIEREKKVKAVVAELKKTGETVVRIRNGYEPPPGHAFVVAGGAWHGSAIDFDPVKHAKLACHVTGVDSQGDVHELCSDVEKHPQAKQEPFRGIGQSEADQAAARLREQLEKEAERRRTFVGTLVASKVTKDDAIALALDGILSYDQWKAWALAARWLQVDIAHEPDNPEVEPTEDDVVDPYDGVDPEALELAIRAHARRSDADRLRVLLATAAGTIEETLENSYSGWELGDVAGYFAFLAAHGYAISKPEQKKLDETAKAEAAKAAS